MPRPDDAVALADVATADELSTGLAEPAHELLKPVWEYAAQLIGQSDVWEAIGKTAAALLDGPLELSEILSVCCGPVVKG